MIRRQNLHLLSQMPLGPDTRVSFEEGGHRYKTAWRMLSEGYKERLLKWLVINWTGTKETPGIIYLMDPLEGSEENEAHESLQKEE